MRQLILYLVVAGMLVAAGQAAPIEMVTVGDPYNAADDTGFGAVDYAYRIGKFEVTNTQYAEFLNAVADDDPNNLYHPYMDINEGRKGGISRGGAAGSYVYTAQTGRENKPVNFVNFWDITRFANWLHNGQPNGPQGPMTTEDGAYTITQAGIDNNTITRNAGAMFFIPTEDEWYKAAYYKGGGVDTGYWDYPTGSDAVPTAESPPGGANSANYDSVIGDYTDVGQYTSAASPYGTFDQGGNIWEWAEDIYSGGRRRLRGGGQETGSEYLIATGRDWMWADGDRQIGFRVGAAIPEPGSLVMLAGLALTGLLYWRRR
jgi:formylglycine-generating enzyme required for sulfatase activity